MSEQKNIVIKVQYPSPGATKAQVGTGPVVVSEWNYKRIGLALVGIFLAAMVLANLFGDDDNKQPVPQIAQSTQSSQSISTAQPEQQPTATVPQQEKVASTLEQPKPENKKYVARAQLTSDITKNEPVDKLKIPLKIDKKETLWIYYFVELKGMDGKAVFHEWWLNGNLVSRKKVNISDDPWRTSSKQIITYTTNNDWIVRVVDEARNVLSETSFNLKLK
jgi:Protein of unknown function (DUF2914)